MDSRRLQYKPQTATETESKVQSEPEPESELKYADVTYLGQIV